MECSGNKRDVEGKPDINRSRDHAIDWLKDVLMCNLPNPYQLQVRCSELTLIFDLQLQPLGERAGQEIISFANLHIF